MEDRDNKKDTPIGGRGNIKRQNYRQSEEYQRRKELRRKQRRRQVYIARTCVFGGGALILLTIILIINGIVHQKDVRESIQYVKELQKDTTVYRIMENKPEIDIQLLTPNEYSRPQIATEKITGIVVHYTANPGTTAQQNRDFFEGLKDSHITSVSSHFVVGLEGEMIQCIPTTERAYASNQRNFDTVSIECCHVDETGKFNDATYDSVVKLCAYLCTKFNLDADAVIRHYDVTGKACPKYFVDNEEEWEKFKMAIDTYIKGNSREVSKEEHDSFYEIGGQTATPSIGEEE